MCLANGKSWILWKLYKRHFQEHMMVACGKATQLNESN